MNTQEQPDKKPFQDLMSIDQQTNLSQELWDKYSRQIDDDIYSLQSIAGTTILTERDFKRAMHELLNFK